MADSKRVLIGGAGPAGLTAALELLRAGQGHEVIVAEATFDIGGISKTISHHGNRIDIGGHRFFSKSDWVMAWWTTILPIDPAASETFEITYQQKTRTVNKPTDAANTDTDRIMLVRNRLSRIYYGGKFFSYPVKANVDTALKLGPWRVAMMLASYARARLFPTKPEVSLEDFLLNRFGRELYETFFKDYTEKVWGVPCHQISAEWGAQRIKGLSISRALLHAFRSLIPGRKSNRAVETSLIESFLYPKYGPGQLWEVVAEEIRRLGGTVQLGRKVVGLDHAGDRVTAVTLEDAATGARESVPVDWFISTMPVQELVNGMSPPAPPPVQAVARGLQYRDFITVGILLKKMRPTAGATRGSRTHIVPDNWIYVQDHGVQVGRLQIFNNWSPFMVADPGTVWVGMEYFCREGDALWGLDDAGLSALAVSELAKIGLADPADCLDSVVLRVPKAYPGYFGSYDQFGVIRGWVDQFANLFLIGRNGMHRYNNQDHSMLTARFAVEALLSGTRDREAIWSVNIDDDYHEEK